MLVRKSYKYILRPTSRQARLLQHNLDLCRELYNAALQHRRHAYRMAALQHRRHAYRMAGKSVSFAEQSAALVECKEARPDLADVYSQTLQDVLHRVDKAFKAFYARVKRGDKPGFPRFRSYDRYDSFTYPQLGWSLQNDRLTLSKIGTLKIKLHRPVQGKVKTVQVKREGTKWFVCFSVETEIDVPTHTGPAVGIDVGLEHLANLSTGEQVENPRYYRKGQKRLAKAQRQLAKVARTHPKRKEYRKRVATCHCKVRNQRADFLHKLSKRLVQTYSLIAIEKLNVKGLAGGMLAKSVNDAAWSILTNMLVYKAEEAGSKIVSVDPSYTSQTCPKCGNIRKKELSERWHICDCGFECHRDVAAALVILARGLASIGSQSLEATRL